MIKEVEERRERDYVKRGYIEQEREGEGGKEGGRGESDGEGRKREGERCKERGRER